MIQDNYNNQCVYNYLLNNGQTFFNQEMIKISNKLFGNKKELICTQENVLDDIKPRDIKLLTHAITLSVLPFTKENYLIYTRIIGRYKNSNNYVYNSLDKQVKYTQFEPNIKLYDILKETGETPIYYEQQIEIIKLLWKCSNEDAAVYYKEFKNFKRHKDLFQVFEQKFHNEFYDTTGSFCDNLWYLLTMNNDVLYYEEMIKYAEEIYKIVETKI